MATRKKVRKLTPRDFYDRPVTARELAAWSALTPEQQGWFGNEPSPDFRWQLAYLGEEFPAYIKKRERLNEEYRAKQAVLRAVPPWPEVFALLEAVPDEGLESMPEDDQCHLCRELAKLLATTKGGPADSPSMTSATAAILRGKGFKPISEWVSWDASVRKVQEMTLEELAQHVKSWEEE